jgi:lipopolysaccharide biosynthesis glycosyltransferase
MLADISVLFCADERYFPHLGATVSSLLANNPRNRFRLIICSASRSPAAEEQVATVVRQFSNASVEFIDFDLKGWEADLPVGKHITLSSYLRLFAAEFLDATLDKILYLDCDIIVCDDLRGLWEAEIDEFYAAAVPEPYRAIHPGFGRNDTYFNAGVLLINLRKWREDHATKALLKFTLEHVGALTAHDQDVLNNVFRGRIAPLDHCWNFQPNFADFSAAEMGMTKEAFRQLREAPKIVHYTGSAKPWLYMQEPHYKDYYREAASRTPWARCRPADRTPANIIRKTIKMKRLKERANWHFPQLCRMARTLLGRRSRVDIDPAIS